MKTFGDKFTSEADASIDDNPDGRVEEDGKEKGGWDLEPEVVKIPFQVLFVYFNIFNEYL